MPSSPPSLLPLTAITTSLLLFFLCLGVNVGVGLSQNTSGLPDIAGCRQLLLPLVPCVPFVQGTAPSPPKACCGNLKQLYSNQQQPGCLCLLLNNGALPLNTTLALQLPLLCNLQVDISNCSGVHLPSPPPVHQVSSGTHPNSTIAAAPVVTVAPRPTLMGFGIGRSDATKLKIKGCRLVLVAATVILPLEVLLSPDYIYSVM